MLDYESDEDGYLLVSLPNESGWSVTVNGRAANVEQAYGGALMAIPVCTGLNHVELSFVPRGLVVGSTVSAISVVVCLVVKRSRRHIA
ncbi:MAG: YfhO family protein [Atopobiaceae bacterium]|nr:YfhO family protein [Atopobiaceae bacterium]MBR3312534.1 YfhO family protein [Atopobiaceae bacterium]